ncbi:sensor histidine kinase [Saccharomonospora xinjiangensis]|uniref:sensor histidine kinase n=1 Tax=Saccharomonospora xinjiangensis TaxID=75294 RepID=UPI001070425D|nr:sensor histidine kinase [Saccharomonospora xinjiangensis]QBQ62540.1 Sensor protein CitS [Saccharomonospora xinjiangensis]
MGSKGSLARHFLGWHMSLVFALLGCVAVYSVIQSNHNFAENEGRALLSVAENVAATPGVRVSLADPVNRDPLPSFAESARSLSGADFVIITDPDRAVLTSPDPSQLRAALPLGDSTVASGRSWVGEVEGSLVAHVPVIGRRGRLLGIVAAGKAMPGFFEGITNRPADALALLGIALVLGVTGSLLLAWLVKRQTLGLEPREITGLVEHRDALLHGIKEGVVGLDQQHRITLANDHARELLALPRDCVGTAVGDLDVGDRLRDVLTGRSGGVDQIVLRAGRVLVLNRMPVSRDGRRLGAVVTLRDRTELVTLREELAASSRATDTLRAQAHEFSNRLHTIAGLIELGEYDEVRNYVNLVNREHEAWHDTVSARIEDTAVAALLIAKASLAAEQSTGLRLTDGSHLGETDDRMSADLVTVVGNLVDNALDAVRGKPEAWVEVHVRDTADTVEVMVRDSGPGVAPEIAAEVFAHGFTTKAAEHGGQRGLGLALTRQACRRRGGHVELRNDGGAVFTAVLPYATAAEKVSP